MNLEDLRARGCDEHEGNLLMHKCAVCDRIRDRFYYGMNIVMSCAELPEWGTGRRRKKWRRVKK